MVDFTTVRLSEPNREAIEEIKERHGLRSHDQAVGLLLIEAGER